MKLKRVISAEMECLEFIYTVQSKEWRPTRSRWPPAKHARSCCPWAEPTGRQFTSFGRPRRTPRATPCNANAASADSPGSCEPATAPVLDGLLDEAMWRDAPFYRMDEQRQFHAVENSAKPWAGVDDLSARMRFAWDDDHLYLAVEVRDDVFANPKSDSQLWNQDGLQFLVDPFRSEERSLGRYDYSLGLGRKGPQVWCHMSADPGAPAGLVPEIKFAMAPAATKDGSRTYEVAIPWTRLAPFRPKAGANLGFTLVVNEDDGTGRKSTIGWFGGVHLKESAYVGDLILTE